MSTSNQNMFEGDAFAISPVTALTKGVFVALLAGVCIFFSIKTYKWGNCRWRPKPNPFRQRLVVLQGGIRRTCRTCCAVPAAALSTCHRHLQGEPLNEQRETPPSSAVHSEGSVHSEESAHSEVRGAPQSSSAGGASVSELTELGWFLLTIGCVICPGFNLLAICLCRRRKRADLGDGDLEDGDLAADLGAGIGADLGAGESADGSEVVTLARALSLTLTITLHPHPHPSPSPNCRPERALHINPNPNPGGRGRIARGCNDGEGGD